MYKSMLETLVTQTNEMLIVNGDKPTAKLDILTTRDGKSANISIAGIIIIKENYVVRSINDTDAFTDDETYRRLCKSIGLVAINILHNDVLDRIKKGVRNGNRN